MKPKNVTIYEAYKMFINEQLFRNNSKRTLIWYNENLSAFLVGWAKIKTLIALRLIIINRTVRFFSMIMLNVTDSH